MRLGFQLIDTGWDKVIHDAVASDRTALRVVCPFIKVRTARRLLASKCPDLIQVITRFHLGEMCDGVCDTDALRLLLDNGAKIRGVQNLHAKLYIFGDERAIVTSANLTEAALLRNHEFGFVSTEKAIVERCREYFEALWKRAGTDLDLARLQAWVMRIGNVRVAGSRPSASSGLSDEGTNVGLTLPEVFVSPRVDEASQSFVKFFGEGHNRAPLETAVLDEVSRSGCHWACAYPTSKRPRQVQDGAVMFMGRLVQHPHDTIIYGRAIGIRHVPGRDEASTEDINLRGWKVKWSMYVRVHHAEFVAGTLRNGIPLSTLMAELKSDSFVSTQEHARAGSGNTDPRNAFRQQASVQLTQKAFDWLNQRLGAAFDEHGKLSPAELETLDWPKTPSISGAIPSHLAEYRDWLVSDDGKAVGTAAIYGRCLTRCAEHYGEVINERTVRSVADVDNILARIRPVVASRGRWTKGTFNTFDLPANLAPALQAYSRFTVANFLTAF